MRRTFLLLAAACLTAACGSGPAPSPSPTPTPAPTPTPRPDTLSVGVAQTGVGSFDLVVVPVAVIHNNARAHAALAVVVHFTPHRANGAPLQAVASPAVDVAPGQTLAVSANCTDSCVGAVSTDAFVAVGSWADPAHAPVIHTSGGSFARGGGSTHGFGDVDGSMSASLPSGTTVEAFAACFSGTAIIGGGATSAIWGGTAAQNVSVAVIVSATPSRCALYAGVGG